MPATDALDRIMEVMGAAFDPTFGEAWTRRQVEDSLLLGRSHYGLITPGGAMTDGSAPVAGFFLVRSGYGEEELLLLAVKPQYRRRGLAALLLQRFFADAAARGAERVLLEMRHDNPAEALYRSQGFVPIGRRANYYRTPGGERLDAVTFARDLGISPTRPGTP